MSNSKSQLRNRPLAFEGLEQKTSPTAAAVPVEWTQEVAQSRDMVEARRAESLAFLQFVEATLNRIVEDRPSPSAEQARDADAMLMHFPTESRQDP